MDTLLYTTTTILSTVSHLINGNPAYFRIVVGLIVVMYALRFPHTITVIANLTGLLLKIILLFAAARPYQLVGMLVLQLSKGKEIRARTRGMMVVVSVLLTYITFPHRFRVETGAFGDQRTLMNDALNAAHTKLNSEVLFNVLNDGIKLPSYIDWLKLVCLTVLVVATLRQSNERPKPTLLDALLG